MSRQEPHRPAGGGGWNTSRLERVWPRSRRRELWESVCDFWDDVRDPVVQGARWALRVAGAVLALGIALGLLKHLANTTGNAGHTGLLATVTIPVHRYVTDHATELPLTAATAYALWKFIGTVSFVLATLRVGCSRPLWCLWGAATVAMTWAGTPAPGRSLAAGVALLGWCLASAIALRGASLRPRVRVLVEAPQRAPEVHADIHIHPVQPSFGPHTPSTGGISLN